MVRIVLSLLILAGCATTSSQVRAEKSERLNMEIPMGWVAEISRTVGDIQIAEYYPPNSTCLLYTSDSADECPAV